MDNGGWICQTYFGKGITDNNSYSKIIDCFSNGLISSTSCGGIVGSYFYGYINDCESTGEISGANCGGIA
jgi:hypothetical protein